MLPVTQKLKETVDLELITMEAIVINQTLVAASPGKLPSRCC
jgi:hypothetical protein